MIIYSPQREAIYPSPNRLDLLLRRRGLADQQKQQPHRINETWLAMVGASGLEQPQND